MKRFALLLIIIMIYSCSNIKKEPEKSNGKSVERVIWKEVDTIDIASFNKDVEVGKLTMDVGVYFPSNLDTAFNKVTLSQMMESIKAAKEIYKPTGVQINLLFVKTGEVNPEYFSFQANEVPGIPKTEYVDMYTHGRRHPFQLTKHAKEAFTSIIELEENNGRTIHLVTLQDVFFPFLEISEGRNWTMKSVRTGGLSFPAYSYSNTLPNAFRGVITITNLSRPDRLRRTVAHELGHKVMNVSHEYKSINPGHEVFADRGLMLYGDGEDIPSGKEGRWHLERLHLSPFLYRIKDGTKIWNNDYKEGGHYYDPLYGDKVVHFGSKEEINKNW